LVTGVALYGGYKHGTQFAKSGHLHPLHEFIS
jgi:hypothetical protein